MVAATRGLLSACMQRCGSSMESEITANQAGSTAQQSCRPLSSHSADLAAAQHTSLIPEQAVLRCWRRGHCRSLWMDILLDSTCITPTQSSQDLRLLDNGLAFSASISAALRPAVSSAPCSSSGASACLRPAVSPAAELTNSPSHQAEHRCSSVHAASSAAWAAISAWEASAAHVVANQHM